MWVICLGLGLLSSQVSAQTPVTCTQGCSSSPTAFPSLDSALSFESLEVVLSLSAPCEISLSHSILHKLSIQGNKQTVLFKACLKVQIGAMLEITGATIGMGMSAEIEYFLEIYGNLDIDNCFIERFDAPFVTVFGTLHLERVAFRNNTSVMITVTGAGATLHLFEGSVSNHTGPFLSVTQPSPALLISKCLFSGNSGDRAKALLSVSVTAEITLGNIVIADCKFQLNSLPLIYLNTAQTDLLIANCSFVDNTSGALEGYLSNSTLEIVACTWDNNGGVAIALYSLQGTVNITHSALSHQTEKGFIRASGTAGSYCVVSVSHTSFSNTHVMTTGFTPGVVWSEYCSSELHNVSISQVTVADSLSMLRSLMYAFFGSITLVNVRTADSGSSGALLGVLYGNMTISDCVFQNPYSLSDLHIGCLVSHVIGRNITITAGSYQIEGLFPGYFAVINSIVSFSQVHIIGNWNNTSTSFTIVGSEFGLSHIFLESIIQHNYFMISASNGYVRDLEIRELGQYRCVFEFRHTNITIQNILFSEVSPITLKRTCILSFGGWSNLNMVNATITNIQIVMLISATNSVGLLRNVTVRNCTFEGELIRNVNSDIELRDTNLEDLRVGWVAISRRGRTSFVGSQLVAIEASSAIFQLIEGAIMIFHSKVKNCISRLSFGIFKENSNLNISDSIWEGLASATVQGFVLSSGYLDVRNASFMNFRMSLFQVSDASVQIENSRFRNGENPEKSLKSKYSYGGVLGCVKCLGVLIDNIKVWNVTSAFGGAIAIRSSDKYPVFMQKSTYIDCQANHGGALFLQNTSFEIDHCTFIRNKAESGGALETNIRAFDRNQVAYSSFIQNSAIEGGAVKWRNAEIYLVNVSFQENTAVYGPDLASYGITLSSRLTNLSKTEVAGVPFTIVFELLDHYGALVSTNSDKSLQLLNTSLVYYLGTKVRFIHQGIFRFSSLTVYTEPGTVQTITVLLATQEGDNHLAIQSSLHIAFRNCTAGEVRHTDRCELCSAGYFSFAPSDHECRFCPSHVFCAGGRSFSVDPQYWRNASNSVDVQLCPLVSKCLGGPNSTCEDGFAGILCSQCAAGYYRFRSIECRECVHWVFFCLQVVAVLIFGLLFAYCVLRYSLYSYHEYKLFLMKTLISHTQYLSALSFLRISLPAPITYVLHAASYVSSALIIDLPLACANASSPVFIRAIIGSLSLPVSGLLMLSLFGLRLQGGRNMLVLITAQMIFTPVIAVYTALPLLSCYQVSSTELLYPDMSEECWSPAHTTSVYALAVPSMLLNLLIPIFAVCVTMRKRQLTKYLEMWKSGYNFTYWECFLVISRVIYAGVVIGTQASTQLLQICYGLIVLICTCVVNAGLQPWVYRLNSLYFLSEMSLVVVSVSHGLTGYYVYSTPGNDWQDHLISAVFLILNGGYVAFALCYSVRGISNQESGIRFTVPQNSLVSSFSAQ